MTFYSDIEPFAVEWLGNLMDAGLIPQGIVDDRDIRDIQAADLAGFRRAHFFAGIGGWELALQLAGWGDAEVWTGSCPCQPFSVAGKRKGEQDDRHLWPDWFNLIKECRPAVIFGEQVASAAVIGGKEETSRPRIREKIPQETPGEGLDSSRTCAGGEEGAAVRSGRACGSDPEAYRRGDLRSDGTRSEFRQRTNMGQSIDRPNRLKQGIPLREYSHCVSCGKQRNGRLGGEHCRCDGGWDYDQETGEIESTIRGIGTAIAEEFKWPWLSRVQFDLESAGYTFGECVLPACSIGAPHIRQRLFWGARLADSNSERFSRRAEPDGCSHECREQASRRADFGGCGGDGGLGYADLRELPLSQERPPIAGAGWSDFDLIPCLDGKSRRVESGSFPLAHGLPRGVDEALARLCELAGMAGDVRELRDSLKRAKRNQVGQLKGYGNAIIPQLAAEFVRAFMETGN